MKPHTDVLVFVIMLEGCAPKLWDYDKFCVRSWGHAHYAIGPLALYLCVVVLGDLAQWVGSALPESLLSKNLSLCKTEPYNYK